MTNPDEAQPEDKAQTTGDPVQPGDFVDPAVPPKPVDQDEAGDDDVQPAAPGTGEGAPDDR
jgi:hypothetical protein